MPAAILLGATLLMTSGVQAQASAPGTQIMNTAQATYVHGAVPGVATSNTVITLVEPERTRATISMLRPRSASSGGSAAPGSPEMFGPTQCVGTSGVVTLPPPVAIGGLVLNPSQPLSMASTGNYHGGEPVFARLVDGDQNRDATVRDTVDVRVASAQTGDSEIVRFTETDVSSGEFVGYIQSSAGVPTPGDCALQVGRDSKLTGSYVDARDATDTAQAQALIDPTGLVFDSRTGQPVNGARVRIIDAATNLPAPVLGDDGVSAFPSEIVTGAQATDSGGTVYSFAPGAYRFPVVDSPQGYRFEIVPPATHRFPSTADAAALDTLPGAPFTLNAGSFGNLFAVDAPAAANIDLPVDPLAGQLFLDKTTLSSVVAVGDFVQYTLRLEHTPGGTPLATSSVTDVLPAGMRYHEGSTRFGDARAADPQIAADGRTLTFDTGALAPGTAITIRYVAEVTVGAHGRNLVNRARASADGGVARSNDASATLSLRDELHRDRAFIIGRVAEGGCDASMGSTGVAGVRVYLEDGRYSVTDPEGKYHFEDVPAGTHVAQLDNDTIPDTLEPTICAAATRYAGRAYSRFVDVQGGSMARADFMLATRKPPEGTVELEGSHGEVTDGSVAIQLGILVRNVAVGNARALLMLPEGYEIVAGATNLDGQPLEDPQVSGGIASLKLGELPAGAQRHVALQLRAAAAITPAALQSQSPQPLRATLLFDTPTQNGQQLAPIELSLSTPTADVVRQVAMTRGVIVMLKAQKVAPVAPPTNADPDLTNVPSVESLAPGLDWILPAADFNPAITSVKVALRHSPEEKISLLLNGAPVSPLNFYGTSVNKARTVAISLWRGVDIPEGASQLTAVVHDADGQEVSRLERTLHFSGGPARGVLMAEQSVLVADGRTRPVVRVKLTDADGQPARPGTLGAFRVDPPHRSWFEVASLNENQLVATGHREPIYTVGADGVAAIELEPTSQSGQVVLHLKFADGREQEVRAWLKPAARDWILVGIAEGTAAHHSISENMEAANAAGAEEGYSEDGRVAFFAKGRIRGDYLLTLAYDSARDTAASRARLHDAIEPQQYYTLYGDGAEQRNEAASSREKLYLKLERNQFYALFGDFDTGLTITELGRYSRTLNGLRTEVAGEHWSVNAFAAHTDQNSVRDELRGDGTSGLYRLSRTPLIAGSDKVRIEIRDRFRTEQIIESRVLARFLDYSIDYLQGTLFFKEPVPTRDPSFNPVFIIVEYETENAGTDETTAGGRAALRLAGDRVEVGATLIHEGAETGARELGGVDVRWKIDEATEFKAEVARSDSDVPASGPAADAYVAEVTHLSGKLDASAYVRQQESAFGLGQQLSTESGSRKVGADGRYRLTDTLSVQGEAYRQTQLSVDAERDLASAEVRYEDKTRGAGIGVRHVSDDVAGVARDSEQAFAQASMDLFEQKLRLRASTELALGSKDDSIDFPSRGVLGADWRLTQDVTLFSEYEHADGQNITSDMMRLGVKASPWNRAQIVSSVNEEQTENGARTFANLGLTQGFQFNDRWAFDVGLDQSNTLRGPNTQPLGPTLPLASGSTSDDYLAAFAGALYRSELWTFTSRLEHRASDLEERYLLTGGFYREPVAGHAFSLSSTTLSSDGIDGTDTLNIDVRLGWAYRPVSSRWVVLDRLDLIQENVDALLGEQRSARMVNTLNANWQANEATEVGLQFGARYARNTFDGETFSGYTDLYGADLRRDLNQRFDIGLHATALNSWSSDVHEYALGFDVGVSFARNVWVAVGYNLQGFRDEDFSQNRYTAQGPFIKLRIKADQDTLKDLGL